MGKLHMNLEDEKRRIQENELLRRESSLRRSRMGAALLGILLLFVEISVFRPSSEAEVRPDTTRYFMGTTLLLAVLGYQYHLQVKHIETIKMYRGKLADLKAQQQPGQTEVGSDSRQLAGG
jgi:hypothetical protein